MHTNGKKPRPGEIIEVEEKSFTVVKEKGDLFYLAPVEGEVKNIHLLFFKSSKLIETKILTSALRIPHNPDETKMVGDNVIIWGVSFKRIGKSNCAAESLNLQVQYEEITVSLQIHFASLSLESATAA